MEHASYRHIAIQDDALTQRIKAISELGFEVVQFPDLFGEGRDGIGICTTAGEPIVCIPYDEDEDDNDEVITRLLRAWDAGHLTLS